MPQRGVSIEQIFETIGRCADFDFHPDPMRDAGPDMHAEIGVSRSDDARMLRLHATAAIPFESFTDLLRPEVLFHPDGLGIEVLRTGPEWAPGGKILELHAPGDATVRLQIHRKNETKAMLLMAQPAEGLLDVCHPGDIPEFVAYHLRFVCRRNHPAKGDFALAMIPRAASGELLSDCGFVSARILCISPLEDGAKTGVVWNRPHPQIHNWQTCVANLGMHSSFRCGVQRMVHAPFQRAADAMASASWRALSHGDDTYFAISLRRCHRGGPLLPIARKEDGAHEFEAKSVTRPLSEYLRLFFQYLGVAEPMVYDSMDGWRVPPYQAVVQRGFWESVRSAFEEPFRQSRSAYRRLLGGTGAPEFALNVELRFVELSARRFEVSHGTADTLCVSKTFVHFSRSETPSPQLRPRCGSLPQLESLESVAVC